ncbi:MAG: ankyrin repeat domain-containing protein [Alphaproteobacteria bacterium]|nr:ankyrin repeat domain-containing protein [Alphaproteobacteria bacterium]
MDKTTKTLINQLLLINGKWKFFCAAFALVCVSENVMAESSPSLDEVKTAIKELNDSTERYKEQLSDILKNISQKTKMTKEEYFKLLDAVYEGNDQEVSNIIANSNFDIDTHYKNSKYGDETALFLAVRKKNLKIAKMLIEKGADVNLKANENIPLSLTIDPEAEPLDKVNSEMMRLLLEYGADPNLTSGAYKETTLQKMKRYDINHYTAEKMLNGEIPLDVKRPIHSSKK